MSSPLKNWAGFSGGSGGGVGRSKRDVPKRELFFWTMREAIKLVVFAALALYALISLVRGELPGAHEVLHLAGSFG